MIIIREMQLHRTNPYRGITWLVVVWSGIIHYYLAPAWKHAMMQHRSVQVFSTKLRSQDEEWFASTWSLWEQMKMSKWANETPPTRPPLRQNVSFQNRHIQTPISFCSEKIRRKYSGGGRHTLYPCKMSQIQYNQALLFIQLESNLSSYLPIFILQSHPQNLQQGEVSTRCCVDLM